MRWPREVGAGGWGCQFDSSTAVHLSDAVAMSVFPILHPRSQYRAWPRGPAQGIFAKGIRVDK